MNNGEEQANLEDMTQNELLAYAGTALGLDVTLDMSEEDLLMLIIDAQEFGSDYQGDK